LSDVEIFSKEQWEIINKRFNFLPPKEAFLFGSYLGDKLVAYAQVEIRGGIVEVRDLLVKDDMTSRGIGGELLSYVEKWAKDNGCRKSVVKTASTYDRSVNFYKKNGYKKDAVLPDYYYGCDWYYMSKEL
jgi:GNAT superfamily N-acetyltransferase